MGINLKLVAGWLRDAAGHRGILIRALIAAAACSTFALAYGTSERAAGSVATQTFSVHVAPDVPSGWLRRSESAIENQSLTLRAHWHTPLVRFGPGGWPIFVRRGRYSDKPGEHGVKEGHPYAVVETRTRAPAEGIFDHEIVEMLVDPYLRHVIRGKLAEICDPVVGHRYTATNGGLLVDWVYPGYFRGLQAGPWDYLRLLTRGAS